MRKQLVLMEADVVNRNGRVYPDAVLREAIVRFSAKLSNGSPVLGESDMPDEPENPSLVRLDRVSHVVEKAWYKDGKAMVEIRILENAPAGKATIDYINKGGEVAVAAAGTGIVDVVDGKGVVRDYEIGTVHLVDPKEKS